MSIESMKGSRYNIGSTCKGKLHLTAVTACYDVDNGSIHFAFLLRDLQVMNAKHRKSSVCSDDTDIGARKRYAQTTRRI
jgi:hypothetical protein